MNRTCEKRGAEYAPTTQWQRFCSGRCRQQTTRKTFPKQCQRCGVAFSTKHEEQVFCGHGCARSAVVAAKYEAGLLQPKPPKSVALCPRCSNPSMNARVCAECLQRKCRDCGALVGKSLQYCDACLLKRRRAARARARKKNVSETFNARARRVLRKVWGTAWAGLYEPISDRKMRRQYQSQDAHCAICASAIDYGAKAPAPLSLSLDHIVALASGGTHYEDNLQPTHFLCNSRKGTSRGPYAPKARAPLNSDMR